MLKLSRISASPMPAGRLLDRAVGDFAAAVGKLERFGGFVGMAFFELLLGNLELLGPKLGREHEAAGAQVAGLAQAAVGMEHKAARRARRSAAAPIERSLAAEPSAPITST